VKATPLAAMHTGPHYYAQALNPIGCRARNILFDNRCRTLPGNGMQCRLSLPHVEAAATQASSVSPTPLALVCDLPG